MGNDAEALNSGPQSLAFQNFKTQNSKNDEQDENSVKTEPSKQKDVSQSEPMFRRTTNLPRQAWNDEEMSLEDASIIEDVEDIPRDRDAPLSGTIFDSYYLYMPSSDNIGPSSCSLAVH